MKAVFGLLLILIAISAILHFIYKAARPKISERLDNRRKKKSKWEVQIDGLPDHQVAVRLSKYGQTDINIGQLTLDQSGIWENTEQLTEILDKAETHARTLNS